MFSRDAMQAALTFLESNTAHIEREVNETVYPEIQYSGLIPVDTSAAPFARTVTYYSSDKFGKADWINGNADDMPTAGTEKARHETNVYMAGIGYTYGYEELEQARMLGMNLPNDDAMAARLAYEQMVDRVALKGDVTKGFNGLINHPDVTATAVANGDWDIANEYDILSDINTLLTGANMATGYTAMADTLLIDNGSFDLLATRALGNDGTITIMKFLQDNNTYTARTGRPLTIRTVRGLEKAGAGSTDAAPIARMIAYNRNPQTLKLHIPMPHRFLEPMRDGVLNYVVPGIFRLGGLDIRKPMEVRYGDGI